MISKICWICFAHPSGREPTGSVYTLKQTRKIPLKVVRHLRHIILLPLKKQEVRIGEVP